MSKKRLLGFVYLAIAVFGLAGIGIAGESLCLRGADWKAILVLRYAGAAVLLLAAAALREERRCGHVGRCLWVGVVCEGSQALCLFWAIEQIGSGLTALILYFYPLVALLFYKIPCPVFVLQSKGSGGGGIEYLSPAETLSKRVKILTLCTVLGPVLASINIVGGITSNGIVGLLFALCASMCYGYYFSHGALYLREQPPLLGAGLSCLGALIPLIPMAMVTTSGHWWSVGVAHLDLLSVLILLTAVPLFFLVKGMQLAGSFAAALLFSCEPMVTAFLAFFIHKTQLPMSAILGGIGTLGLIILAEWKKNKSIEMRV